MLRLYTSLGMANKVGKRRLKCTIRLVKGSSANITSDTNAIVQENTLSSDIDKDKV